MFRRPHRWLWVLLIGAAAPAFAQPTPVSPQVEALVVRGTDLARAGQLSAAIDAFEKALRIDPADRDARYNLALACYSSGDFRRAAREFQRVLDREPTALDARKGLGFAQLALHQYADAAASLRASLQMVPGDGIALGALGRAYMGAGNPRKAVEVLRQATTFEPSDPGLWFELGKALRSLKQWPAAAAALGRALTLKPDSAGTAAELARVQTAAGQPALATHTLRPFAEQPQPSEAVLRALAEAYDALKLPDEALAARGRLCSVLPPKQAAPVRLLVGQGLLERTRFTEALEQFRLAAAADPTSADARAGQGRALTGLGQRSDAVAQWEAAVRLAPRRGDLWVGLAQSRAAVRDWPGALKAIDSALSLAPNDRLLLQQAVDTARLVPDLLRAESYLRRILALDPSSLADRFALADLLVERGQPVKALVEAAESLRAPQPAPEAYMKVAYLAERLGSLELAMTQWRRLMDLGAPHELPAGQELGRLLLEAGRPAEAAVLMEPLQGRYPAAPRLAATLARAYQAAGRDGRAVELLARLLRTQPDWPEGQALLALSQSHLGRHDDAVVAALKAISRPPVSEESCRALAAVCSAAGRPLAAAVALERLLPADAPLITALSLIETLAREADTARDTAARLLALFDQHPEEPDLGCAAARLLAAAAQGPEDLVEAEQTLLGVSKRPQMRTRALRQIVLMYLDADSPERALEPLRRLMEPFEQTAGVIAMLAELEPRPDMARERAADLRAIAQAEPQTPGFWCAVAPLAHFLQRDANEMRRLQAWLTADQPDPAVATGVAAMALLRGMPQEAERAISLVPDERRGDHALLVTLAQAQAALGKPDRAMNSLRRAFTLSAGGLAEDHVFYARLCRETNDPEDALWHLVIALSREPELAAAAQGIRELIADDKLPPDTVMEGLRQVYFRCPDAPVVHELVAALSQRPDAAEVCADWLRRHPRP
jgi:tetratricopeptide (TPR) repeat protein